MTKITIAKVLFYRIAVMFGTWTMIMYLVQWLLGNKIADDVMVYVLLLCWANGFIKLIRYYLGSRHPVYYKLVKIDEIDD